jgi:hypothetical protein
VTAMALKASSSVMALNLMLSLGRTCTLCKVGWRGLQWVTGADTELQLQRSIGLKKIGRQLHAIKQ